MSLSLPNHIQELIDEARGLLIEHLSGSEGATWLNYCVKREELADELDLEPQQVHRMLLAGEFNGR